MRPARPCWKGHGPPRSGVPTIRSSVVASQIDLHERFGGVVPEIASRAHVRQILPVIDEALRRAGVGLDELGDVAVATRPGLVGALVVGLTAAKALALALDVPLVAVDHLEGHLYACQLAVPRPRRLPVPGPGRLGRAHEPLRLPDADRRRAPGRDDRRRGGRGVRQGRQPARAGLSRAVPGSSGPRGAATRRRMRFPRLVPPRRAADLQLLGPEDRRPLRPPRPGRAGARAGRRRRDVVADVAASFQEAVVDVLVGKTRQALRRTGMRRLGSRRRRRRQRPVPRAASRRWPTRRGRAVHPAALALHRQRRDGGHRARQARGRAGGRAGYRRHAGLVRPGR